MVFIFSNNNYDNGSMKVKQWLTKYLKQFSYKNIVKIDVFYLKLN